MKQHVVIFNRAPLAATAGWIHIVPKGELPNAEAGIVQVLDDASMDAILAGIAKDKNRLGDRWPGVYAGREHFIYDETKDSAALAWFKDFEKRADGIWAKEDGLTPAGADAVKNREYKFTSFVSDPKQLQKLEGKRFRITGIETIGFTNQANGKELLTPIANRSQKPEARSQNCPDCGCTGVACDEPGKLRCPDCKTNFAGSGESADSTANNKTKNKKMNTVCTLLGLSAEADEASVHAAVTKLKNRVAELEPLADENTKLKNRVTAIDSESVDTLLAAHGVKEEKVMNRLKPIITALPTLAEREAALGDFGFKKIEAAKPAPGRVLNRGNAAVTTEPAADEVSKVEKIRNRCSELTKGGYSFDAAWAKAVSESSKS